MSEEEDKRRAREALLEKRVDELQADCSRLENERRKWKALYESSRALLSEVLVDIPLLVRLAGTDAATATAKGMKTMLPAYAAVAARNEQLENDAWTHATTTARAFVKAAEIETKGRPGSLMHEWVEGWVEEFRTALSR